MNLDVNPDTRPVFYSGLAERLISEQLISSTSVAEIADQARAQGVTLVQELLDSAHIDSAVLARMVSEEYGLPLFDLTKIVEDLPLDLVPQSLIRKHRALPLYRRGNRLFLGIADPTNKPAIDEFKFATGIATDSIVVEHKQLLETIDEVIAKQDEIFDGDISDFTSAEDYIPDLEVEEELEETDFTKLADDAPVVKFVNKVLFDAIKQGASDIHFEPYEREYRVRVRADGVLQEVGRPPKGLAPRLAARLKSHGSS
jgi:type IV pilus assembly protein PilB